MIRFMDPINVKIRFTILCLIFLGLVVCYLSIYGLDFSLEGNQYTFIAIILGLFMGLLIVPIRYRELLVR
jgi:hypothetical protein